MSSMQAEHSNSKHNPFGLSPEHNEILDLATNFARDELSPLQERMDNEGHRM
jgi:isovaleryl-CoA dehydrogenase